MPDAEYTAEDTYGRTKRSRARSFSMVLIINPPAPSHHIRPKPGHASGWQAYGMAICQPLLLCSPWTTQIISQHTSARRCLSHCRPDDRSECLLQLFFDVRVSSALYNCFCVEKHGWLSSSCWASRVKTQLHACVSSCITFELIPVIFAGFSNNGDPVRVMTNNSWSFWFS